MGIFSRRTPRDGPVTTSTTHEPKTGRFGRNKHAAPAVLSMSTKPTFGQWLKATWIDIATMAAMGMIGLGVSSDRSTTMFIFANIF